MYLQNIFDAPDNKRQLSADSQMFEAVDKFYRYLMRKTYNKQSIALHAQQVITACQITSRSLTTT